MGKVFIRGERMKIIQVNDYREASRKAADIISSEIILNNECVLGLATGSTPLGLYKELIDDYRRGTISFKNIVSFNLDEYVGLGIEDKNSYKYYMKENFFKYIDIHSDNTYIPDGKAKNLEVECQEYEKKIVEKGGIDVQILGIGRNGHIGFNEPRDVFLCETHIVKLDEKTIEDNSRFFERKENVPKEAISMGIKTIMRSKKILLIACGEEKADAICKTINGKVDPNIPASVLKLHKDVTVIVDKAAARYLELEEGARC